MSKSSTSSFVGRRGELLAESFIQALNPTFFAKPDTQRMPFDYFVGFTDKKGLLKTYAVEVKATEKEIGNKYTFPASKRTLDNFKNSNLPVMFLVADVKRNRLFYNWAKLLTKTDRRESHHGFARASIPLIPLETKERGQLIQELLGQTA